MNWRMNGRPISTADASATVPVVAQQFEPPENILLKGAICTLIAYGDPAFTSIAAEVWSDNGGSLGKLIAQSEAILKSVILVNEDHAVKYVGFNFVPVSLRGGTVYHLALRITGYTGNASSHIAWRQVYPDPIYPTGLIVAAELQMTMPFDFSIVAATP